MPELDGGKRRLGFKTSASDIQDEFEVVVSLLSKYEASWAKSIDFVDEHLKISQGKLEEARKSNNRENSRLILALQRFLNLHRSIALLGVQLSLMQEQLTRCEKDIKELKTRTK